MPTLDEIDSNHCRYYLRVLQALDGRPQQGKADQAFDTLAEKWPNIRQAQAYAASRASSDEGAARDCAQFARGLESLAFWMDATVARAWFEQGMVAARLCGDRRALAELLASFAIQEDAAGHITESVEHFRESAALYREQGDRLGEAFAEAHLGHVLLDADRLGEARTAFNRALILVAEIDNRAQTVHFACTAHHGLGKLEKRSGNPEQSRDHLATAATLAREGGCLGCEAPARNDLAHLAYDRKQYDLAFEEARQAATLFRRIRGFDREAEVHWLIARIAANRGDPEGVESAWAETERAERAHAEDRGHLTRVEPDGHPPMAKGKAEVSTPRDPRMFRHVSQFRRFVRLIQGGHDALALKVWDPFWQSILPMNSPQLMAEALGMRGACCFNLGDMDGAIEAFEQAIPLARSIQMKDFELQLIKDLGRAFGRAFKARGDL